MVNKANVSRRKVLKNSAIGALATGVLGAESVLAHSNESAVKDVDVDWSVNFKTPVVTNPHLDDSQLFVGVKDRLFSFDRIKGSENWSRSFKRGAIRDINSSDDGYLDIVTSRFAYRVATSTGETVWKYESKQPTNNAVSLENTTILAEQKDHERRQPGHLTGLNKEDGTKKWRMELDVGVSGDVVACSPSSIIVVDESGIVRKIREDGLDVWNAELHNPANTSPLVNDGSIYVTDTDGRFYRINRDDGTIEWQSNIGESSRDTTPALYDPLVLVGTKDGLYALDKQTGDTQWKVTTNSRVSTPFVHQSNVYLATFDGKLQSIDATNGKPNWSAKIEPTYYNSGKVCGRYSGIKGKPTVTKTGLYVVTSGGQLFAFQERGDQK